MAYDDIKAKNQGSVKQSEVFSDKELDIIKANIGETGIKVIEQLIRVSGDALRRLNYILWSPGRIRWDGTTIHFDSDTRDNDIYLRLLQTEEAAPRTIDLKMNGSQIANTTDEFLNIDLADGELLYLELDRDTILSSSGSVDLENAVGGGSVVGGYTVKKASISSSSGMPALITPEGGNTQTFYIPIAMRVDWNDGFDSHQDIWWIPHGIKWPMGTTSTMGSVIVKGLETWPTAYVRSQAELIQEITALGGNGGIILATSPFNIDTSITIPAGVTFAGRTDISISGNNNAINLLPGGRIILSDRSRLERLYFRSSTSFGASANERMVQMSGERAYIENCEFEVTKPDTGPSEAICVYVDGNENRLNNCRFNSVVGTTYKIGIDYISGSNNIDLDSMFT